MYMYKIVVEWQGEEDPREPATRQTVWIYSGDEAGWLGKEFDDSHEGEPDFEPRVLDLSELEWLGSQVMEAGSTPSTS